MKPEKQKEWLKMFASMSLDCLGGGITWETFIANAKAALRLIEIEEAQDGPPST